MEQTEREKIRRLNCKLEPIYRNSSDQFYTLTTPALISRSSYPWESESKLPRITKEFFRCKGSPLNAPIPDLEKSLVDCDGYTRHGLPIIHGKEDVYPVLVDLLNYVQKKTNRRVIITCGHRCPAHNAYADSSKENRVSKHQVGAEVDFYVQGMEEHPHEIAGLLMQFFQESPLYVNDKEMQIFKRVEKSDLAVQPWMNKEILIKLFQKNEGRDADNRHPYPYLSIQVRMDRDTKERVVYDWSKANHGYPRS